jgi:hypothetical protein
MSLSTPVEGGNTVMTCMPTIVAAQLVAGHVDILWDEWAAGRGCCPECCASCGALRDLLESGQLDELYGYYLNHDNGENSAWDNEMHQVGRQWLTEAWSVSLASRSSRSSTEGPFHRSPVRRAAEPVTTPWTSRNAIAATATTGTTT